MKTKTLIDGREYVSDLILNKTGNKKTTKVLIPVFITNPTNKNVTRICIESLNKFSKQDVEIWVIDNNSPNIYSKWLVKLSKELDFNLILNRTEPVNPFISPQPRGMAIMKYWGIFNSTLNRYYRGYQSKDGSYANAIGLELGIRYIDQNSESIFTMHNDTLVTKTSWLNYFKNKLNDNVKAAAFRIDPRRVNAIHIAGMLIDYSVFKSLDMSFLPNMRRERYANMPEYDVGDQVSIKLREQGYEVFYAPNTFNDSSLTNLIKENSPFDKLACDRCFDEDNEVFYMHLGRGTHKSDGTYKSKNKTTTAEEWVQFAEKHLI